MAHLLGCWLSVEFSKERKGTVLAALIAILAT